MTLVAAHTLGEIYGPDLVFNARASARAARWLPSAPGGLDALTGASLTIAGEMPVIASRAAATERGLDLVRAAGVPLTPARLLFGDEEDYLALLRRLAGQGHCFVVQHLHPEDQLPADRYWVSRDLLAYLNNKANLPALVPPAHVGARAVIPASELERAVAGRLPVVVKAAVDDSSGAGIGVVICREPADLARAAAQLAESKRLVVEEFLHIEQSFCTNFAVLPDARVLHLGTAEQVCDAAGGYGGNWLSRSPLAPEPGQKAAIAVGRAVAHSAAARGWRGCLGVDVALLADGRAIAHDLNFRTNGSTVPLLLFESVARSRSGCAVGRSRGWTWRGDGGFAGLVRLAGAAAARGVLVPYGTYDPDAGGPAGAQPRLSGLLVGASREEVCERERELAAAGLV
jgi:hypothetical protein